MTARRVFCCALALAGCSGPPPKPVTGPPAARTPGQARGSVEQRVDETRGLTTIRIRPPADTRGAQPHLLAGITFAATGAPAPVVLFGFKGTAARWRYRGCPELTVKPEGGSPQRYPLQHEPQIDSAGLSEVVFATLPVETLRRIASGAVVSIALCRQTFNLRASERDNLREFLARLP